MHPWQILPPTWSQGRAACTYLAGHSAVRVRLKAKGLKHESFEGPERQRVMSACTRSRGCEFPGATQTCMKTFDQLLHGFRSTPLHAFVGASL
eukprot:1109584-Pelagomonas_calceolata.AAC.1